MTKNKDKSHSYTVCEMYTSDGRYTVSREHPHGLDSIKDCRYLLHLNGRFIKHFNTLAEAKASVQRGAK